MSTPGLPPIYRVESATNPAAGDLYGAATVVDLPDPARLSGGVEVEARSKGAHGRWPAGCLPEDFDGVKGGDDECTIAGFPSTVVWASDDRKTIGVTLEDAELAAQQTLRLSEPRDVGQHLAGLLLEAAGTPATAVASGADSVVAALGAVESASTLSTPLVVHAHRSVATLAASRGLVVRRGERLETPLGNRWVFGTGYAELAGVLIASGPVTVLRSEITTSSALDMATNIRQVIVEREIAAYWDGDVHAAAFDPTPGSGSGPTVPGTSTWPGTDTTPTS